ncbi:hypothetical protein QVD17_08333 [Tagetes erecta]|uniref:Uncharacterized protein n=1 Tax=Tagetes erecta TaxID=13708 RepID=A0AAD8KZ00_TARER|nr:hypothetical protein QVD17_08333 [Tagetes erecta]
MKTLLSVELTPLHITTLPLKTPSYTHTKKYKIHAKAKGFNGAKLEKQKSIINEEKKKMKDEADDKIPDVVMERMIVRILFNVGVPLVTGLGLLQVFSVIKEQNLWQIPRWLPFLTTFITFGASALGIAFGTLSASWDAEDKGSLLGFEEAKKNWVLMWDEDESSNE